MFKDAEKRVTKKGFVTYWKDGVMIGRKCTKCGKDKPISEYGISNSKKNQYRSDCKSCHCNVEAKRRDNIKSEKVKSRGLINDEWKKENWEEVIRINKQWLDNVDGLEMKVGQQGNRTFWKDDKIISKYCTKCGELKEIKDFGKRVNGDWKSDCKRCERTREKEWCKNNREIKNETAKKWRNKNIEKALEMGRGYRRKNKENNLIKIANLLDQINPFFKQLNLPVYGYIYKFKNAKTRHVYIGQSTQSLKERYGNSNIIKGWIKERLDKDTQKFINELIEEDIELTEVLDVACCRYHLNILEANYITKYDSYNNGYNNNAGHYKDDTGKEEFEQILKENGLEFIDGKLTKKVM